MQSRGRPLLKDLKLAYRLNENYLGGLKTSSGFRFESKIVLEVESNLLKKIS